MRTPPSFLRHSSTSAFYVRQNAIVVVWRFAVARHHQHHIKRCHKCSVLTRGFRTDTQFTSTPSKMRKPRNRSVYAYVVHQVCRDCLTSDKNRAAALESRDQLERSQQHDVLRKLAQKVIIGKKHPTRRVQNQGYVQFKFIKLCDGLSERDIVFCNVAISTTPIACESYTVRTVGDYLFFSSVACAAAASASKQISTQQDKFTKAATKNAEI